MINVGMTIREMVSIASNPSCNGDLYDRIIKALELATGLPAEEYVYFDIPKPAGDGDGTPGEPLSAADLPTCAGTGDTPAPHATHGEGSVRREDAEPVAWGVAGSKGLLYATSVSRMDAVDMQSEHACDTHVVPLYRSPTLTDAEREAIRRHQDPEKTHADT